MSNCAVANPTGHFHCNELHVKTVNQILNVAYRLFMEKGYEHTSIQDILNNLGGLSKGAIYHHFASKEDILVAVIDRLTYDSNKMLDEIAYSERECGENGVELNLNGNFFKKMYNTLS